jgi:threonine dehydratase
MPDQITLQDVQHALALVRQRLLTTPLVHSPEFSQASGNTVYFKLESLQHTHAFKVRGALNKVASLSAAERQRGVVAASSGNHALGVAYASRLLGVEATVVMPATAPPTKIELARGYGATVVLHGQTYDDAFTRARALAAEQGKALAPSFDDPQVIAGQGTIVLEVLEVLPEVELFVAPIGGGGLVSGLAFTLAALGHRARVVGVEAEGAASMLESLRAGRRIKLPKVETIADGIAIQQPGVLNFAFVQRHVQAVLTVSDEQIAQAMARMLFEMKVVVEPAAAAPVAALLFDESLRNRRQTVCCVISGGNISRALLQQVAQGLPRPGNG